MKNAIRYKVQVVAVVQRDETVNGALVSPPFREDVQIFEQVVETIDLAAIAAVLNKKVRIRKVKA